MFSELRNDQRRRISDHASADRIRDRDNAEGISVNYAEIGDNSTEIGDGATGILDIAANVIPC